MKFPKNIKSFTREEDGSLLVFFCISIIAILGIFALSFDMGRRASTQTDMQSFADNVALAAAGELDGSANAIVNARAAATSVIIAANENLKAGTGAANLTLDFNTDLIFFTDLPERDRPGSFDPAVLSNTASVDYKYSLPAANRTTDPTQARFVGVTLNTRDVDWLFAGVVSNNVPDAAVGALAIAGNSAYTCEVAPLMFCLPEVTPATTPATLQTLAPGRAVQLRSVGRDAAWNAGEFGFLNIDRLIANDPNAAAGVCASYTPESRRQACLLALGIEACFNSRNVDIQPGQRSGQETAGFNIPFGIFEAAMGTLRNDPGFEVGPHIVSGRDVNNGNCNDSGPLLDGSGNPATMGFPLDDCHYSSSCADGRFGDGNWSNGLDTYLDTNYRHLDSSGSEVRPGDWFEFPVAPTDPPLTRYEYYLKEIERAANGGVMSEYAGPVYNTDADPAAYSSWDDYWPNPPTTGYNPIIPDAHARPENGLPQCSQVEEGGGTDRRVVVIAGIDCVNQTLTGNETDVPVVQYYRTFMLSAATEISNDPSNGQMFDLWVEIIEPIGGEGGGSTTTDSAFREIVQLYR